MSNSQKACETCSNWKTSSEMYGFCSIHHESKSSQNRCPSYTKQKQAIIIPLPNGMKLTAESSTDESYPNEIYIGLLDNNGVWHQDIAIVKATYHYEKGKLYIDNGKYDVLVYSDVNNEDYTHKFTIDEYKEETDIE